MKSKHFFRILLIPCLLVVIAFSAKGQGSEPFTNHTITGTAYVNGSFVGANGITWNYTQCTGEQTYPINGKGILLRRSDTPSKIASGTIPGGIGNFSVQMRKASTGAGDRQVELFINGISKGVSQIFGTASGADATIYTFQVNNINMPGDITIEIRHKTGGASNRQLVLDNLTWTGFAPVNSLPVITNVSQIPEKFIAPDTSVNVSANVEDYDGTIALVQLRWGQNPDELSNIIPMSLQSGTTYQLQQNIPARPSGTKVYYQIYAEDNKGGSSISETTSYVVGPKISLLEKFNSGLGNLITYSVAGNNNIWNFYAQGQTAQMNGGESQEIEEDWLILPSLDLKKQKLTLDFDTWQQNGSSDFENYLKLYYSTNYPGQGNPANYTWIEIPFGQPELEQQWLNSGIIDLTTINSARVFIGFKYLYTPGNFVWWQIDNIKLQQKASGINFLVTSNSAPLANATVDLNGRILKTNASGQAIFDIVEPAIDIPYTVSMLGYHTQQGIVSVGTSIANKSINLLNNKIAINVVANPDANSAAISWTGSGAEMYGISYFETATQVSNYVTVAAGPVSILVSPQTSYGVRVRSLVNGIWTAYSPTVLFTSLDGVPIIAHDILVDNITSNSAQVNWTGQGADFYGVWYFNINNTSESYYFNTSGSPYSINVLPGRTYQISVRTSISGVWTKYSPTAQFATPAGTQTVASNVVVSNIIPNSAQVNWTGDGAELYGIYYYNINNRNEYYYLTRLTSPVTISVLPGNSYQVRVKTRVGGIWTGYTPAVGFSTPTLVKITINNNDSSIENPLKINLYPNPATDYFYLSGLPTDQTELTYSIFDVKGSIIKTEKLFNLNGNSEQRVDLTGLSQGIYFVKVTTNSTTETLKFIVQ